MSEEQDSQKQAAPKALHDLKLNERMHEGALEILRVPGGWIYTWAYGESKLDGVVMTFVPYSTEFKKVRGGL